MRDWNKKAGMTVRMWLYMLGLDHAKTRSTPVMTNPEYVKAWNTYKNSLAGQANKNSK